MRRRIREAIVGVAAIIILALGIPLAIIVHRWVLDAEVVELQATAATALAEIDVPIDRSQLESFATEPDAPEAFAVYDASGARVFGAGPNNADPVVNKALAGHTASSVDGEIVVATPIVEPGTERVLGVLRVTESLAGADQRSRTAWLIMGTAGLGAMGLAWLIGTRLAKLLALPLTDLASSAASIGEPGSIEPRPRTGIAEIDELAAALAARGKAVYESLQRERQFSADVSHQLRTPITSLRLQAEGLPTDLDARQPIIADLDRVDATMEHLLAIARDATPLAGELPLEAAVTGSIDRWQTRATAAQRSITSAVIEPVTVRAHRRSVDEVLDVLIDNALRHGEGTITVALRKVAGGAAVDVSDEGRGIELLEAERIFERGHSTGDGEGIGLAVARSIAEAEGGRLLLSGHHPTRFSLVLLDNHPVAPAEQ